MLQELNQRFAIGETLKFEQHASGLVQGIINSRQCTGSFFLLGAHIATFQPKSQSHPILFMSDKAVFEVGKPIRGGIPICFPWFGANKLDPTLPAHGLVRTALWEVLESKQSVDDVTVILGHKTPTYNVQLIVEFAESLDMCFVVENDSLHQQTCEIALHTYFQLGDARQASVLGLEQYDFRDQLTGQNCAASGTNIKFTEETDRVYNGSVPSIAIDDPAFSRRLTIQPRNSRSTVVWNPWIAKSQRLSDFGDFEFEHMCCIETANVSPHNWILAAGQTATIGFNLSASESR